MTKPMKKTLLLLLLLISAGFVTHAHAAAPPLRTQILSSSSLSGTAGDFVTVQGQIANTGSQPQSDVTTYLSLMDNQNKLPVDLEDWSAEKGLYIGTIEVGQTLPLNWKIHLVKAGAYSLVIIAEVGGNGTPQVSRIVRLDVSPKHNLDPGHVLPVALGTPIVVALLLFLLTQRRRVEG
jgi:hypothetical protein